MHRRSATIALGAFILCCLPLQARAAEYRVEQCGAASRAHDFVASTLDPGLYTRDDCTTTAALTLHGVPGAHVIPYGAAAWIARAPAGTSFTRWEASFQGGTGGASTAVYARACWDEWCTTPDYMFFGIEHWGAPIAYRWENSGAPMLQFVLQCSFGASDGCNLRSIAPGGSMFAPKMALQDHFAPSGPQLTGGTLPGSGWQSGRQQHTVAFTASDLGGGIDHVSVGVDSGVAVTWTAPCERAGNVYTRLQPCPLTAAPSLPINLGALSDGPHDMWVTASDVAGQSGSSGLYRLLVDNTPPVTPQNVTVDGGESWRAHDGFALRWQNPPLQHAPITAVRWRLCPRAGGPCRTGRKASSSITSLDGIALHGSGEYRLKLWLEDAAGNHDEANAATATLRLDPDPPHLAFAALDPANPQQVNVDVDDPLSGLAEGEIEVRRQGTDSWEVLPTQVTETRLTALLDDERFADGTYVFRARAVDRAGNQATTIHRADGTQAGVRLPVRIVTRLRAGIRRVQLRRRSVRKDGRRRTVKRRVTVLVSKSRAKPGQLVPVTGALTDAEGKPLTDASVAVYTAGRYGQDDYRLTGELRTDEAGRFTHRVQADQSKVLLFRYMGSASLRGSSADVDLGVVAGSTIHVSDRRVRNGDSVTFSGRLSSLPVPADGKLVEMQAFFRDRWRTFSTLRTDSRGRWSFPYGFGGTVGTVLYRFRIRIPREGGYPFEAGHSNVKSVTVRGP